MLTGPTGTGKSDFALRLAREFPIEIVSVDSAQVYRGLDIGSAKPDAATRAAVPHHLIDLVDPNASYSAGQFVRDAARRHRRHRSARASAAAGRRHDAVPARADRRHRHSAARPASRFAPTIDADAQRLGWPALHARLAAVDAAAAARIHPNDAQRIQRALEVHAASGRPISELQTATTPPLDREFICRRARSRTIGRACTRRWRSDSKP